MKPYLTQLSAVGLKSGDFTSTLSRVNLVVGRSRAGKTRVLDAARLALSKATILGRNRELKDAGAAIMGLARNGHIDVTATDSQGRMNRFTWKRGKACQVVEEGIPMAEAVLMDSGQYFSLSDTKKVDYVFSLYPLEESDEFSGPAIVAALKNIRLEENTAETEAALSEVVAMVDDSDTDRHQKGQPIQEWLAEQIKALKERLSVVKATADRMTKTVQGITQLTAAEAPARNFQGELDEKRKELSRVVQSVGSLEQNTRLYEEFKSKVERMREQLAKTPGVPVPIIAEQVQPLRNEIQMLSSSTDDAAFEAEIKKLTDEADGIQEIVNAYRSARPIAEFELKDEREALDGLTNKKNNLAETVAEEIRAHDELMRYPCCPSCGTPMESMRLRLTQAFEKRMAEHKASQEGVLKLIEQSKELIAKSSRKLQIAIEADQANAAKQKQVQELLRQVRGVLTKQSEARVSRQNAIHLAEDKISALEGSVKIAEKKNKARDELARDLAKEEAELSEWKPEAIRVALQTARDDRRKLEAEIQILQEQQREYQRQQDDQRRDAQARLEHAKAHADLQITKAAIEKLEDIQTRMVEAAFGRILQTVNAVTTGIIPEPIVYRDGVLGRWDGKTFISHENFSGTEKALTYAGISLALAERSEIKVVMMDELGIMDEDTLRGMLQRMLQLVETGLISQFIGCLSWAPSEELTDTDAREEQKTFRESLPGINVITV